MSEQDDTEFDWTAAILSALIALAFLFVTTFVVVLAARLAWGVSL